MFTSLPKILEVFPQFNKREHTANDFWRISKERKITVKEEPLLIDGYYRIKRGKPIILLNRNLYGLNWTVTAFHELVHDILDVPVPKTNIKLYRESQKIEKIQDKRAEAFALILAIPKEKLFEMKRTPFDLLDSSAKEHLIQRQYVYESNKKWEDEM